MKAIILAAGKSEITSGPISNVEIAGHRILDLQVSVLRQTGIDVITTITGFAANQVSRADVDIRRSKHWSEQGSVASLCLADDHFDGSDDVLIAYGDTVFDSKVINELLTSTGNISIVGVDGENTKAPGAFREYGKLDSRGNLSKVSNSNINDGEYFVFSGLVLVRRKSAKLFIDAAKQFEKNSAHVGEL